MGWGFVELRAKVNQLHESNPMLGHRGCRLAITFPEIYEMQARAILEAACDVAAEGIEVEPEIMIPLAMTRRELDVIKLSIEKVKAEVFAEKKRTLTVPYGT